MKLNKYYIPNSIFNLLQAETSLGKFLFGFITDNKFRLDNNNFAFYIIFELIEEEYVFSVWKKHKQQKEKDIPIIYFWKNTFHVINHQDNNGNI